MEKPSWQYFSLVQLGGAGGFLRAALCRTARIGTRLRWQASLNQCGQASNSPSSPRSFARFGGGFKRAESAGPCQLAHPRRAMTHFPKSVTTLNLTTILRNCCILLMLYNVLIMKPIKSLTIDDLKVEVTKANLPAFRTNQLLNWLYVKGVASYDEMTNLPKALREQFALEYPLFVPKMLERQISKDGSRKYLLELYDGALVETVALPSSDGRLTVCASSQSGCAMNCAFCATGKQGLTRSLYPGEIVDQILVVQQDLEERVTNVVVMGQGEPFANYDATLAALRILNHPKLLNIGARHITVSTCGVLSGIQRLANEPEQFTLAVSLHAATQAIRDILMPSMKNQPLTRLKSVLNSYTQATGRRFSFEYALMKGMNDSNEDLTSLIDYAKGMLCHINLIPLNDIDDSPIKPVGRQVMERWLSALESANIPATIRLSRGSDISAACGQLAYKKQ